MTLVLLVEVKVEGEGWTWHPVANAMDAGAGILDACFEEATAEFLAEVAADLGVALDLVRATPIVAPPGWETVGCLG